VRTVAVVVQACPAPGRPGIERVKASIEASDIGKKYDWREHPPGMTIEEHLYASMRAARDAGADLVLRLEDDVLVNRHILHNLGTWAAVDDPRFGMGWAFDPPIYSTGSNAKWPRRSRPDRWHNGRLPFSQAVVMRSSDIETLIVHAKHWYKEFASYDGDLDNALCYAALAMGKQICIHAPSLTEHLVEQMPSTLGHRHLNQTASSCGSFDLEFKRGAPLYDRYGRMIERH
jgi:hypothetical protein